MSKLQEIFDDLSVAVFKAQPDTIDSLMADGKRRTQELFLGHLWALKAMFDDPSMNAMTPSERVESLIQAIKES